MWWWRYGAATNGIQVIFTFYCCLPISSVQCWVVKSNLPYRTLPIWSWQVAQLVGTTSVLSPVSSKMGNIFTYIHTSLTAVLTDEPGLAGSPLSLSPYILLTSSHHVLLRQYKRHWWRKRSGEEVHFMRGNWCKDFDAERPCCYQPVLKVFTWFYIFFSHKQTPEDNVFMRTKSILLCNQPPRPSLRPFLHVDMFSEHWQWSQHR